MPSGLQPVLTQVSPLGDLSKPLPIVVNNSFAEGLKLLCDEWVAENSWNVVL